MLKSILFIIIYERRGTRITQMSAHTHAQTYAAAN